jgi:hypothetical protein
MTKYLYVSLALCLCLAAAGVVLIRPDLRRNAVVGRGSRTCYSV